MADNEYTSEERLYLNSKGEAVGEKDPDRQSLLVAAGGSIPIERARELGLVNEEGESAGRAGEANESEAEDGAMDPTEESARVQASAGGAATGRRSTKTAGAKKSAKK